MQITIDRGVLLTGLQTVMPAVGTNTALPILSHLLMEIDEDKLTLTGSDLETAIRYKLPVGAEDKISFSVPARKLTDIVRALPDESILLSYLEKGQILEIKAGKSHFKIKTLNADDYPKFMSVNGKKEITVEQNSLRELITKTVFASSKNLDRMILSGILFQIDEGNMRMTATDGTRMARISYEADVNGVNGKYVVPAKSLKQLLSLLNTQGMGKILFEDNLMEVQLPNTTVGIRLLAGEYPDCEKIIPESWQMEIELDTEALYKATKRVAVITDEKAPVLKYSFANEKLILSSSANELGEAVEELQVDCSEETEIGFNPAYLIEALEQIDTEKTVFRFTGSDSAVMLKPTNGVDYTQLLMPIKL